MQKLIYHLYGILASFLTAFFAILALAALSEGGLLFTLLFGWIAKSIWDASYLPPPR